MIGCESTASRGGISVAVPARNEERSVGALLDSLVRQSRPPTEIVVCDSGSTDRTCEVVRSFSPGSVRLVEAGPSYPGRARNLALQSATQPWVAFIDCGCLPEPAWLEALASARDAAPDVDVVYGDYDPFVNGEWDAAQALVIVSPRDPATGCRPPSTASMLIRRDVFLRLGGFAEHLRAAEDLAFFEALARAGARVAHAPAARIRWTLASSPTAVFRRLRLYSAHHAAAGLARTWHHRVLAMDVAALALALGGLLWSVAWAVLAVAGLARVLRTVLSRRKSAPSEAQALTPGRLIQAMALLVLADAACVLGYLDALRGRVASSPQ